MSNFKFVTHNTLRGADVDGDIIEIGQRFNRRLVITARHRPITPFIFDSDAVGELISILSYWQAHGTLDGWKYGEADT